VSLSIPRNKMVLKESAIRGVARPERGDIMIDLVTTAPSSETP